eukprot:gene428-462_t
MGCGTSSPTNTFIPNAPSTSQAANSAVNQSAAQTHTASKPLTQPKRYHHGSHVTQGDLNNMRSEFWTSRVEGNTIMWQTIRSAAEALLSNDCVLANAILEASNIATPNGTLEVCYDERGFQYKIPIYCYCDPVELSNEPARVTETEKSGSNSSLKAQSVQGLPIKLRVRINPGDINVTVEANTGHTVSELKHIITQQIRSELINIDIDDDRQRIMFMGKEIANKTKLCDAAVDDTRVLQVFLRAKKKD